MTPLDVAALVGSFLICFVSGRYAYHQGVKTADDTVKALARNHEAIVTLAAQAVTRSRSRQDEAIRHLTEGVRMMTDAFGHSLAILEQQAAEHGTEDDVEMRAVIDAGRGYIASMNLSLGRIEAELAKKSPPPSLA